MASTSPSNNKSPRFGQSNSSAITENAAKTFVAVYCRINGLADDIHPDEIHDGNLQYYISNIFEFASRRAIPTNFDDNFNPTGDSNRCLTTNTLLGYVGQHLKFIRKENPLHRSFINLETKDFPLWYTELRDSFKKEHDRFIKSCSNGMYSLILGDTQCHL